MSPVKKPIKISVIDEDAVDEKTQKNTEKAEKKELKESETKKKTTGTRTKGKKIATGKKEAKSVKKSAVKKTTSKKSPAGKKGVKKTSAKKSKKAEEVSVESENDVEPAAAPEEAAGSEISDAEEKKSIDSVIMNKKKLVTQAIGEEESETSLGAVKKEGTELNVEESLSRDDFAEKLKMELENTNDDKKQENASETEQEEKASQEFLNKAQVSPIGATSALSGLSESEDEEIQEIVKEKNRTNRSIGIYKKIVAFFGILLFLCGAAVLYFVMVKVTIVIVPDQERMSNNLIFDVHDNVSGDANSSNKIQGVVKTVNIENEKAYSASGEEVIGKEAVGKITLINNYSKNQMLVATTRLLTPDGKLFRLENTVNVPAGGEIEAEIYADEPSPEMAIDPSKFSIPGLWAGLQDKIYGESDEKIVYQQKIKKYIVQDDIDSAIRDMKQQLLVKAKTEISKDYDDYDEIIYDLDEESIESTVDAEAGDEVDEVLVTMSADVIVIAFEGEEAAKLAEQKFISSLSVDKELVDFDSENIIYSLNNYNSNEGTATINATFEGKVSLRDSSSVVEKNKIVGLNQKQLEAYLANKQGISGYDVRFSPSFLPDFLKRVPRLPERIETEIKK